MSTVCLVRPLLSPSDFNGYPLNLLILASCLLREGHKVEICDFDFLKEIDPSWLKGGFAKKAAKYVADRNPDFVGITSMCSNYVLALDFAEELKRLSKDIHITLGGPHVSLCAKETMIRYSCIDSAVIGEGEITYPELINTVNREFDLSQVKGIAFRQQNNVVVNCPRPLQTDLNFSPRPAYQLVDMSSYISVTKGNYLEIYAGSGCPFKCSFCSTSIVWERKYRTMSPTRIADEMEFLNKTYGATSFNLIHDNLTTNKIFLEDITKAILDRRMNIKWGFSSRVDTINAEIIREVSAAGCDYVFFGIESGSEKIQKTMRKRLKLEKVNEVINLCLESSISPTTSFILGFPDEDLDDIASTIRLAFLCRVSGARRSFINLLSAYTGTPVMNEQFSTLSFSRESMNSTMAAFLEEQHFKVIENDKFIFSNYYSLNYDNSSLTAVEYSDIVDFYTICLFKYRFTISRLINELNVCPIQLFRKFHAKMHSLTINSRNHLDFTICYEEIEEILNVTGIDKVVKPLLTFDEALWQTTNSKEGVMIFTGPVKFARNGLGSRVVLNKNVRHFILTKNSKEELTASEISPELSNLYKSQGMAVVKS
jgi:radical SAM superfamily enzyme YgiQ (UPF0313 family)